MSDASRPEPTAVPHGARPRDHMPCLDGLRGLAAVIVVLGHARDFGLPSFVDGSARDCGVLIFFALSGFLMGDLYLMTPPTLSRIGAYGVARVARIVPIYYLVVVTSLVIHWVDPAFVYAVTSMQLLRLLSFNGNTSVFWSIGPEVQFYVVFVGLWCLRNRLRHDGLFTALGLVSSALALATIHHWPGVFVGSKFHIFAIGMLAALLRHHLADRLHGIAVLTMHIAAFAILAVFLVPGLGDALLGPTPFDRQADPGFASFYGSLPRALLAATLSFAFSFQTRFAAMALANPVAALLGRCSFSIYLLHVAVYDVATRSGLLARLPGAVATLMVLIIAIGLSLLSNRAIETPARNRIRAGWQRLIQSRTSTRLQRHPA